MINNLIFTSNLSKITKNSLLEFGLMIVFILVVGFFQVFGIGRGIILFGRNVVNPLLSFNIKMASSVNSFFIHIRQQYKLARRVQDLELKLAQSSAQLGDLDQLRQENQELRKLLNSADRSLSRIVLSQPIVSYAQPTISVPSELNLLSGTAVLVEGVMVGVIRETKLGVASIDLLWSKDVSPVLALTDTGVQGLVVGDGRRVLLTEVPIDQELEIGQRVITVGQRGVEKGLFLGEVRSILTGNSSAVKTAVLEQYVSFYEANLVEVRL